jgi:zinc protease
MAMAIGRKRTRPVGAALAAAAVAAVFVLTVAAPTARAQSRRREEYPGRPPSPPVRSPTTFLPSRSSPLVALRFVFLVGSADDPLGKEGLAALTAALVAQGGTGRISYEQVLERFYPLAASLDGSCRKEVTVFQGVVHRDNLMRYSPLVASMLTVPRFDRDDFTRLKNEALDDLTKTLRSGNDEELGKWALQLALYRNHPYGHVDAGTVRGLGSITLDDVRAFHRAHYTQPSLVLGVAGRVSEPALDHIKRYLGEMHGGGGAATRRDLPEPEAPRGLEVTVVRKPTESTAVSLGFPIKVTRRDDDFYALAVANSYLGEHRTFNGKLMQDLRGKRGLNYGDYSYIEDFVQEGMSTFPVPNNPRRQQYFSVWVRPVPHDKAAFALRWALWELDRLVKDGMTPAEFEATRDYLLNYSKLWVQTLSRRLGYAMDGAFYDREDLVTEMARRLPKLTVEQVNAAVRRHLTPPGVKVAIVTRDADALVKVLKEGKPTPISYDTQGTPADVLEEDKQIAAFPLRDVSVTVVPVEQMFEK